ncbi:aromatic ring-hydroxylating oxygenase subunit alpha [Actinomadura opuntiae]|uniref:aromatic ring-hydroxylating oxygenase subunit alpha n=1 Tax=Actinomadura sp. OS1-43 TaxID=604315 RepID=UPI00255B0D85|nr:aromatic ring-hydroxylating dioxygenase subunit alpha [Actinomadura sp. OS1-43]MDL4814236.1 aromatic ring-hydroxylating dioxygenase subunit alpha [Actinomadura sp. OS1-43]
MTLTSSDRVQAVLATAASGAAHGTFPVEAFADDAVYQAELDRVFAKSWLFVAHESEIAEPGDYVLRHLGEDEVIVTRDEDGRIHVLYNACRHRGAPVCRGAKGNSSHFRCPYHGWTYRNDGTWASAPRKTLVYKNLDTANWGLLAAPHVAVKWGLVFASPDPAAPPFDEYLGDMAWYLEAVFGLDSRGMIVMGEPERALLEANWKTGAENYCGDALHVAHTHKSLEDLGISKQLLREQEMYSMFSPGKGHATFAWNLERSGLPVEAPWGYPKQVWDLFDQGELTADQQRFNAERMPLAGLVFPNFGFFRGFSFDPVSQQVMVHTQLRLYQPRGATKTEVLSWLVFHVAEPEEYRTKSYRDGLFVLNAPGILEQDDFTLWNAPSRVGRSRFARDREMGLNYQAGLPGMSRGGPIEDHPGPGESYDSAFTEGNIRAFQRHWLDQMNAADVGSAGPDRCEEDR